MNEKIVILIAAVTAMMALVLCATSISPKRTLISLANARDIIPVFNTAELMPVADANLAPNTFALANEARLTSRYYSEGLTSYVQGWRDPNNIEDTLNFVAPPVQVGRRFEFKKSDSAEEFLSETDDLRSIGSAFKRVDYKGTSATDKTLNKGLTIRVDRDEANEIPGWREQTVRRLKQRILRNELRRVITALSAAATNTAKTWDTTALKDPDFDVLTDLIAAVDASGIRPNRVLFGDVSWNKRALSHRAQSTAGGFASASLTPQALAGIYGVDEVRVSRERFQSGAAAKTKVVLDIVLEFFAQNDPGVDDPSHCKRFWSPVEGGGMFRVFEEEVGAKFTDITVEHYSNAIVLTTLGLRKLTIS